MNQSSQRYGFVVPTVLFFVVAFVSIPVLFWLITLKPFSSNVKGASTSNLAPDGKGFYVKIKSPLSLWDLNVYLCKDTEDCSKSLTSGKSIARISGGKGDDRLIPFIYSDDWKDNTFLKVFVKTSWGSGSKTFTVVPANNSQIVDLKEGQVVLISVQESSASMVGPINFSEN